MKLKLLVLGLALTGLGCLTGSIMLGANEDTVEFTAPQGITPNSVNTNDTFKVSIEIVMYSNQMALNPITTEAVKKAIAEWTKQLPINVTVYTETPGVAPHPFFGVPPAYHDRPGIIQILFVDMNMPPYNYPQGIVGLWQPYLDTILLDDRLESEPHIAFSVALHELGHFFGLPHVVSEEDSGLTGYIMVPKDVDAKNFVMSPEIHDDKKQDVLSSIEISLAREHVLHFLTDPSYSKVKNECTLTKIAK